MQLSLGRCLALLLLLGICWAAPQPQSSNKQEQLVRVYRIDEKQYERMLKLTEGKNVISEARLINGGFATVSESLSSGWHSLLRIVGLTTISKADEEAKLDIDGQPLCVIKTREGEGQFRDDTSGRSSGKAIDEDEIAEEPIHCIVVLKDGDEQEQELPSVEYNPNFSNYWTAAQLPEPQYTEPAKVEMVQEQIVDKDENKMTEVQLAEKEQETQEEVTTEAPAPRPQLAKKKHRYSQSKKNGNPQPTLSDLSPRQYGQSIPYLPQYPPPSPYAAYGPYAFGQQQFGFAPPYAPYGPYNPQIMNSYGSYSPQTYQPFQPISPYGLYQSQAAQSTIGDDDDDDNLDDDSSYEVEDYNYWGYRG